FYNNGLFQYMSIPDNRTMSELMRNITNCGLYPNLIENIHSFNLDKPIRFYNDHYWSKSVPSFDDPQSNLLVIGLTPAVNGGNRIGEMSTGDSPGQLLMKTMFETGFANHPTRDSIDDGLVLSRAYVTSVIKCTPPNNKSTANYFQLFYAYEKGN